MNTFRFKIDCFSTTFVVIDYYSLKGLIRESIFYPEQPYLNFVLVLLLVMGNALLHHGLMHC